MTSSTPPSPLPPDVDRSTPLQTSFWVPFAFTVPVLIARFYVRIARKRLGIDDWFMLIGWILYTVALALSSALVARGATRHIWYLSPGDTLAILKLQMLGQAIGIPGFCFAKLSVALLLTRLLDDTSRWRKWFLYLHIFVYFALGITVVGLLFGQCRPARALWEPHLLADGATCPLTEPYNRVGQTHSALGAYLDFVLALFPITIVYNMNATIKKRVGVAILLGLGVFAGVCASFKTAQFDMGFTATQDPTYNSYNLFLWTALELPFIIIGGCIPPAKPLWDRIVHGKPVAEGSGEKRKTQDRGWWPLRRSSKRSDDRDDIPHLSGVADASNSILMQKSIGVEHTRIERPPTPEKRYADARWTSAS